MLYVSTRFIIFDFIQAIFITRHMNKWGVMTSYNNYMYVGTFEALEQNFNYGNTDIFSFSLINSNFFIFLCIVICNLTCF
jgi:hypothetical protein